MDRDELEMKLIASEFLKINIWSLEELNLAVLNEIIKKISDCMCISCMIINMGDPAGLLCLTKKKLMNWILVWEKKI